MRGRRTAFTIIELLVLIAAIGILIGLLIPAVQQLRAVAARAECANNLKQIGLAALSYEHANKRLPPGIADSAAGVDFTSQGSIWTTILPYLEQGNLYKQFDLSQDVERSAANNWARHQQVAEYLCPADGAGGGINYGDGVSGQNNYLANIGTTAMLFSSDMAHVGLFNVTMPVSGKQTTKVRSVDITDGTSTTAMFSETTRSTVNGGSWPITGDFYNLSNIYLLPDNDPGWNIYTPMAGPLFDVTNPAAVFQGPTYHCNAWDYTANGVNVVSRITYRGWQYYRGIVQMQNYTHTVPPNYQGYDCGNQSITGAHIAARSYHMGGINVCFADGSVRFISEGISFATWQALGTRAAGDQVDRTLFD